MDEALGISVFFCFGFLFVVLQRWVYGSSVHYISLCLLFGYNMLRDLWAVFTGRFYGGGFVVVVFLFWWFQFGRRSLVVWVDGQFGAFQVFCRAEWHVDRLLEEILTRLEGVGIGRDLVWLEIGGRPLQRGVHGNTLRNIGIFDGCTVRVVYRLVGGAGDDSNESSIVTLFDEALERGDSLAISKLISSLVVEREESSGRWKALTDRVSSLGDDESIRFVNLYLGCSIGSKEISRSLIEGIILGPVGGSDGDSRIFRRDEVADLLVSRARGYYSRLVSSGLMSSTEAAVLSVTLNYLNTTIKDLTLQGTASKN